VAFLNKEVVIPYYAKSFEGQNFHGLALYTISWKYFSNSATMPTQL